MSDTPESVRTALADLRALGGDGLVKQMATVFIEHSAGRLGTMQTAIDAGDLPNVAIAAHTLMGSARQLGLTTMAEACHRVELAAKQGNAAEAKMLAAAVHEAYTAAGEWLKAETA